MLASLAASGHWAAASASKRTSATEQVARLRDEHAVYVVGRGRINVAGFTSANIGPFADALGAVIASR